MPEMISWGPFVIQTSLLAVIAAAAACVTTVHLLARTIGDSAKQSAELLQNALFMALLLWKFGHVLFAPAIVWERPSALLILNGGSREAALGAAAAIGYVFVQLRRKGIPPRLFLDLLAYGGVAASIVFEAIDWRLGKPTSLPWGISISDPELRYHPVSVYMLIVSVSAALLLWRRRGSAGEGAVFRFAAYYMGIGLLLVTLWDVPQPAVLLLAPSQWQALALAGAGIISSLSTHNSNERR